METPEKFTPIMRDLTAAEEEEFEKNKKITLQVEGGWASMIEPGNIMNLKAKDSGSILAGRVIKSEPHPDGGFEIELEWVAD